MVSCPKLISANLGFKLNIMFYKVVSILLHVWGRFQLPQKGIKNKDNAKWN